MVALSSCMRHIGVVKSFEVSSISFASSGTSLHTNAESRTTRTKTLMTFLLM